jgi:nucleotide-binding universal stress UspA family protein
MPRDLIVGFDGSAGGRDALALARSLALLTGARPHVLSVRPHMPGSLELSDDAEELARQAGLTVLLDEARGVFGDVPGTTFSGVAETSVARAVHRAARSVDAALVVLGATHRSGTGRVIPGTTADAVIHGASCGVVIAPRGYAERPETVPFGLVVAAIDGGGESERVADVAARIARCAGATLRLTTVVERPWESPPLFAAPLGYGRLPNFVGESAASELLERLARGLGPGVDIEQQVLEGDVAKQLALRGDGVDLLVIGARGYGRLRRVALDSAAEKIIDAASSPVLVIPRRMPETLDDAIVALAAATTWRAQRRITDPQSGTAPDGTALAPT